jgi:adenylate cyclase
MLAALERIGTDPQDSPDQALQKRVLVTSAVLIAALALVWGLVYIGFGEPLAGAIPLGYGLLSFASLAVFAVTRRFVLYRGTHLVSMLVLPFALQLVLGGFLLGSAVLIWSFFAPIGALLVASRRLASLLLAVFVALVVVSVLLEPLLRPSNNLPQPVIAVFFVLNLGCTASVTFAAMLYFVRQKDRAYALLAAERARSERLLLNVLPGPIADRLKHRAGTIADRFEAVSVLFADVVGFTPLSTRLGADELVALLNTVFSDVDDLARKYGLEKIRTIGDAYMAASGIPTPRTDHAQVIVAFALELRDHAAQYVVAGERRGLPLRIGIASGPAVAGVIGTSKFQYDLWGDTVNTASRMESHGVPGRIQLTEATYRLVRDSFECVPRGEIDIKGKGRLSTWFVEGPALRPPGPQ